MIFTESAAIEAKEKFEREVMQWPIEKRVCLGCGKQATRLNVPVIGLPHLACDECRFFMGRPERSRK